MRKKIAILGSTGSIGKTVIDIIKKDKKNFEITLLTADKNYKELIKQAKYFKVKNLIISDPKRFVILKKDSYCKKINVYQNFKDLDKIFKKKNQFIMSSITGLDGLSPTLKSIKYTQNILIANKESIICGWNLIKKKLIKYKTNFIPVDSEHFSIWSLLNNNEKLKIEKIYITASGGPFLNLAKKNFSKITVESALKHPKWKMGKKISIDSATMMNKLFEVIEAKNIFNIPYKKIEILIHPNSYVHAIVKFSNGLSKLLIHDTSMKIPIFNALYFDDNFNKIKSEPLNIHKLNKLNLSLPNKKKFPSLKILNILSNKISLYETVLVTANDEVVKLFLNKKIKFMDINKIVLKLITSAKFTKYKKISPLNLDKIMEINRLVRLKIKSLSV
jgi:1-deoxy-D-xylulose-5-phosphate reductoisomerase